MTSLQIGATKLPQTEAAFIASSVPSSLQEKQGQAALKENGRRFSKSDIRRSLRASTLDGTFSSAFENIVKGVLISNFLLGLGAGAFEIGMLTSIPMVAHLLQPVGAYFSEKVKSRHLYCLWIYSLSRLLWVLPAAGIFLFSHGAVSTHQLTLVTLVVLALSNILDSVGCASWMSWMAVLVPTQLRGRYFSLRRSLSSLTALLAIPMGGWLVSHWMGGEVEGYGIVLLIAVAMGLISLGFQFCMRDVNPQEEAQAHQEELQPAQSTEIGKSDCKRGVHKKGVLGDRNFLILLLFLGLWTFGLNLSKPFFNFYLLDNLEIDVQWVTIYGGIVYGAFFLMIMLWGRLADRIGNRPVLMLNCLLTATVPLIWLYTGNDSVSIWLVLPLLHVLQGGSFAALELCLANIQMELAPRAQQSSYFAIAAAVIGVTGALGTTAGSLLAELPTFGLTTIFVISAIVRLMSITPLVFVEEKRSMSVRSLIEQYLQHLPKLRQPTRAKA